MKKFGLILLSCAILMMFLCVPTQIFAASAQTDCMNADIFDDISDLFYQKPTSNDLGEVILGGIPVGISLAGNGIEVLGFSDVITQEGVFSPAADSGLEIGDKIIEINGKKAAKVSDLSKEANLHKDEVNLTYLRDGKKDNVVLVPKKDVLSGQYKLGLWAKDASNGIGTLTFVKNDKHFASLGHPITSKNGEILEISGGNIHECVILGVNKGMKGEAGELRGAFSGTEVIGEISKNNKFGVYGKFDKYPAALNTAKKIKVAEASEVKPGKAFICSTIEGKTPSLYEIEIIKTENQSQKDDKGLVIKVTDKRLLEKTGGIVQGMSGSPIIQNDKLVGAVTHVFINDPTKGFGMFAQWMLDE